MLQLKTSFQPLVWSKPPILLPERMVSRGGGGGGRDHELPKATQGIKGKAEQTQVPTRRQHHLHLRKGSVPPPDSPSLHFSGPGACRRVVTSKREIAGLGWSPFPPRTAMFLGHYLPAASASHQVAKKRLAIQGLGPGPSSASESLCDYEYDLSPPWPQFPHLCSRRLVFAIGPFLP